METGEREKERERERAGLEGENKTKAFRECERVHSQVSRLRSLTHTHTHVERQRVQSDAHTRALPRALYLLMLLFKNAVGGRALNHSAASPKRSCGAGATQQREAGRGSLSARRFLLAASSSFISTSLGC